MIHFLLLAIITVFSSYFLLVLYLIIGWLNSNSNTQQTQNPAAKFSIIIPFRNETGSIESCIQSLSELNYPKDFFELILVNDNSTDNSAHITDEKIKNLPNAKLLHLTKKRGKKAALELGIEIANNPIIITTDADCNYQSSWLNCINQFYQETNAKMIVGPVLFNYQNTFDKIQALDFLSLTGTAISTHFHNHKILSNGANLIFEKKTFTDINGYSLIDSIPTGDDILLMNKFNSVYPNSIKMLKNIDCLVRTAPSKTLAKYLNQRIRWASKISSHQNTFSQILGLIIFLSNSSLIVLLILGVVNIKLIEFFLIPFVLKCFIDFLFLFLVARFFGEKRLLWLLVITELFNMFTVPIITITSLVKGYSWKGRQY